MKHSTQEAEEYGEFKGTTEATLRNILEELRLLRSDVGELKNWRQIGLFFVTE